MGWLQVLTHPMKVLALVAEGKALVLSPKRTRQGIVGQNTNARPGTGLETGATSKHFTVKNMFSWARYCFSFSKVTKKAVYAAHRKTKLFSLAMFLLVEVLLGS